MTPDDMRVEVGRRLRSLRERKGKSRKALAGLAHKSEIWLRKIESGQRGLPLEQGLRLARLLDVGDLSEIYGPEISAPVSHGDGRPVHPSAEAVGRALTEYVPSSDQAPSAGWVRAAIDQAWRDWHSSPAQRTYAATELPALIRASRAAVREHTGDERRGAQAAMSDIMHLGQAYLAWQGGATHWYWLTVDRGHQAGEDADELVAYATSLLYSSLALRVTGREEEALDMQRLASDALGPLLPDGTDDVRGLWGALQLARASTTARHRHDQTAWTHWDAAESMASRMPDGYHHPHGYSRGHVDLHRTWIAQCLGDVDEALRHAEHVDVDSIPSRAWQASHLVHVAQSLHQRRDSGALVPLMEAADTSAEAVRYSLPARQIVRTLAHRGPVRRAAVELADRLDIAIAG